MRVDIRVPGWYQLGSMSEAPDQQILCHTRSFTGPLRVHLMGICGTGMAALAGLFHARGDMVTGSDNGVYPPMSDFLHSLGIEVKQGYQAANLEPRPDLVVVGNVIRRNNPEAVALENSGITFISMPEALDRCFANQRTRIVVAGTHGKTTLSSMIAWTLYAEDLEPGFMIGGLPGNFGTNHRLGTGRFFVIEGDEYDTAYFDKQPKFLHYHPHIGIITSCEFDHADIYDSLEQIQRQFHAFAATIPRDGCLVACGDDPRVREIISGLDVPIRTYGRSPGVEWALSQAEDSPEGFRVAVLRHGRRVASGTLPIIGFHNTLNALAAVAAAESCGVDPQKAVDALGSFRGVKRRQEVLGEEAHIMVMDDFAHHPSAVKETCAAVRSRFPDRRVVAVFEPRTNTSRRSFFQQLYVPAFSDADLVVVREPRDVDGIPPADRFDSSRLASDLRAVGTDAHVCEETSGVLEYLEKSLRPADIVLVMSNGNFDNLAPRLLDALRGREE